MRNILLLSLLLFVSEFTFSQVTVSGFVKDAKGKSLPGVSIAIKDSYDGGTSDSSGKFSFSTSEKGEHVIVFTAIGFKTVEEKIILSKSITDLSISMKEEFNEMKAVVITAGTFEASDRKRAAAVLSSLDIVTTASANGDVTGALKTLPGAQQVGETEGLFVRGGTAAETKIFIDGTLVNKFYYSSAPNIAGYGRFSPFIFKGTVFSTGGYSALYGQALSSAVILESIDLPERTSATLGVSVLSLDGGYQYLNKKKTASWGINYNYTNLALAFAVLKQKQDYSEVPQYNNLEGNFRIQTSKTGMLKYYGVFSNGKFAFTTPSLDTIGYFDQFKLKNSYTYHNIAWRERIGTYWKFSAGISYTNNQDKIHSGLQDASENDVTLSGLEFKKFDIKPTGNYLNTKAVFERRLSGLSAVRFGGEYNYSNDHAVFTSYTGTSYPTTLKENLSALFAETDIYVTNALAAKIGGRLEHSSYFSKTNFAPRISLAYKTGKESQASLAYGIFYQNPETKYLPSPSLDFMKATHYIAQYQKTTSLQVFRAELFYKKYDRLVKTGFNNSRDGIAVNNNGYGDAKGFEFFWRDKKTIKNLDYWISYSYLDTKRDFLNFPSAIMPNFVARHTANLVVKKFVMPWKTGFNVAYNYASSRPYYNISFDSAGKSYFSDRGSVPDYHNVSFSVNYIPSIGKQNAKSFVVYVVSVSNIFNLKQTYGYQYSYNGFRKEAIVPPSRMFIFIGAFFSFGIDRSQDAINNNL
jgi:vitamin B12 transporter